MEYTPISPFMRPISHAHLRVIERPEESCRRGQTLNLHRIALGELEGEAAGCGGGLLPQRARDEAFAACAQAT